MVPTMSETPNDASGPDTPAADGSPSAAEPPNRRLGFVLIAVVFLVAIMTVRWYYATSSAFSDISVETGTPECTGTTVRTTEAGDDSWPAAEVVPGMRCEVPVTVANAANVGVFLDRITLPGFGPDSTLPVQVVSTDDVPTTDAGADAEFVIERRLEPDELVEYNITYEYRDGGCLDSESYIADGWPAAEVSMSRRSKTVLSLEVLALLATDQSRC